MNLRLLQISDSALPVGGFTHSWGLEGALARRLVVDAASLETWARGWLVGALAPLEGVVAGCCCRAAADERWSEVARANDQMQATIVPPTLRAAAREMGDQLLALGESWEWSAEGLARWQAAAEAESLPDAASSHGAGWSHAVVFGVLGALAGGTPAETVRAYLHQAVLGMVAAGVRAIPVGHTHGQQLVAYLHGDIERLADAAATRTLAEAGSGAPFYEVLCDEQTRLYSRMFRS